MGATFLKCILTRRLTILNVLVENHTKHARFFFDPKPLLCLNCSHCSVSWQQTLTDFFSTFETAVYSRRSFLFNFHFCCTYTHLRIPNLVTCKRQVWTELFDAPPSCAMQGANWTCRLSCSRLLSRDSSGSRHSATAFRAGLCLFSHSRLPVSHHRSKYTHIYRQHSADFRRLLPRGL